jgi:hypothetical protein
VVIRADARERARAEPFEGIELLVATLLGEDDDD